MKQAEENEARNTLRTFDPDPVVNVKRLQHRTTRTRQERTQRSSPTRNNAGQRETKQIASKHTIKRIPDKPTARRQQEQQTKLSVLSSVASAVHARLLGEFWGIQTNKQTDRPPAHPALPSPASQASPPLKKNKLLN